MDDVMLPQRSEGARIISFESFLRRTSGSRQDAEREAVGSPFGHCEPLRPLNQRQISHRRAMLKYMQGGDTLRN
jgi:hypothetical protein